MNWNKRSTLTKLVTGAVDTRCFQMALLTILLVKRLHIRPQKACKLRMRHSWMKTVAIVSKVSLYWQNKWPCFRTYVQKFVCDSAANVYRCVRIDARSAYYVHVRQCVCLSVRPSLRSHLQLDGFPWNLIFMTCTKIRQEMEIYLKSDKVPGTFHEDLSTFHRYRR